MYAFFSKAPNSASHTEAVKKKIKIKFRNLDCIAYYKTENACEKTPRIFDKSRGGTRLFRKKRFHLANFLEE